MLEGLPVEHCSNPVLKWQEVAPHTLTGRVWFSWCWKAGNLHDSVAVLKDMRAYLFFSCTLDWTLYLFVPLSYQGPCLSEYRSWGTGWIRVPAQQPTPLSNEGHLLPKSSVSKTESAEKISIINIPFNTSPAGQTVWRADSARWRMLFLSYMGGFCNVANQGFRAVSHLSCNG